MLQQPDWCLRLYGNCSWLDISIIRQMDRVEMDRLLVDLLLLIHSGRLSVVEPFWLVGRLEYRLGLLFQLEE